MLLLQTYNLLAQTLDDAAQWIDRWGIVGAVIDSVNTESGIPIRDVVIEPTCAEIFPNRLQWMAECLRDASAEFRPILERPERQQRRSRWRDPDVGRSAGCIR